MTPRRWFVLPRAARPAFAVAVLGALLALTIVSGRGGGMRVAADSKPASNPRTAATVTTVSLPDVAAALTVLGGPAPGGPASDARASRSEHRVALTSHLVHRWVRPYGGYFSSPFGYRWGHLHAGIDLAGPWGSPFYAATDGCIEYAGPMAGYGEVMRIRDWDGTETVYGHMSSFIRTSGCVQAGEAIARIGATGDATGPHLHFEVRVDGVPIDPVPFLAHRGVYV